MRLLPVTLSSLLSLRRWFSCCRALPARTTQSARRLLQPPSELFGDFFEKVAMSGLFVDSKQWADAIPKQPAAGDSGGAAGLDFDSPEALGNFLMRHFELNPATPAAVEPEKGLPLCEHIAALWPLLTRESGQQEP